MTTAQIHPARSAVRAQLLALRAARSKRRSTPRGQSQAASHIQSSDPYSSAIEDDVAVIIPEPRQDEPVVASDPEPEVLDTETPAAISDEVEEPVAATEVDDSPDASASEPDLEASSQPDTMQQDAVTDTGPDTGSPTAPEAAVPDLPLEDSTAGGSGEGDVNEALYALPGAGPGLVWMLSKAGITSLEDLAQADATELAQKMGLVGEILDLGYWIEWASRES